MWAELNVRDGVLASVVPVELTSEELGKASYISAQVAFLFESDEIRSYETCFPISSAPQSLAKCQSRASGSH